MQKFIRKHFIILLFTVLLVQTSCNSYQKVLKSDDPQYKYDKAMEFYNKGSYYKAIPIIEELLVHYKGTEKAEELYYYYATAYYQQGVYTIAAYHFKSFVSQYPYSDKSAECLYMFAMSHYNQSPQKSLDQTNTYKAIEAFQLFINTYPESEKVAEANDKIDRLRDKLEKKAVDNADLYYKTGNYRAASSAYLNVLNMFPDIEHAESINFKALKAIFRFAENSTYRRQVERYEETMQVYKDFIYKFPQSQYMREANRIFEESNFRVIRSSLNHALLSPLNEKEKMLRKTIRMYEKYAPRISDNRFEIEARSILEEANFLIVKSNYQLAQNSATSAKSKWYNKTINSYLNFIDKYSSSKFADEAEKIYQASTQNLNKIKNG